jgi:hypothetical protein
MQLASASIGLSDVAGTEILGGAGAFALLFDQLGPSPGPPRPCATLGWPAANAQGCGDGAIWRKVALRASDAADFHTAKTSRPGRSADSADRG